MFDVEKAQALDGSLASDILDAPASVVVVVVVTGVLTTAVPPFNAQSSGVAVVVVVVVLLLVLVVVVVLLVLVVVVVGGLTSPWNIHIVSALPIVYGENSGVVNSFTQGVQLSCG